MAKKAPDKSDDPTPSFERFVIPSVLLMLLLIVIYGNSFHGSFLFDDLFNIVENPNIHSRNLSLEEISPAVHGVDLRKAAGHRRPVSYLTLAANHSLGGLDPFGYHLVNFAVHALTALLLFFFTYRILCLSAFGRTRSRESLLSIALLSAALWASHPIQVTAVTYIVQRMAALAALFTLLAMFSYVEARTAENRLSVGVYTAACLIFGALAVGSKENAAMLPVNLLLLEMFVVGGQGGKSRKLNIYLFGISVFLVLFAGLWFTDLGKILAGYENRPFTLGERLLTEPRVFLFYISQLLYPVSQQFTMLHDVELSTGLLTPWTTLPAILLVAALPVGAWLLRKRWPLISFSILFFWANHLIEGTVIPLEIIFEHRNYLPSMFFFIPLAMAFVYLSEKYSRRYPIFLFSFALLSFFIFAQGHTVHMRNHLFRDPKLLWKDNTEKSPELHRPHHNLANEYYAEGRMPEALLEAQKALQAKAPALKRQKYITWYNLGLFFLYEGSLQKALDCFEQALYIEPSDARIYHKMAVVCRISGRFDDAEAYVNEALRKSGEAPAFLPTLCMILLQKGEIDSVLQLSADQLKKPDASKVWFFILGEAFRNKEELKQAAHFFKIYRRAFPDQVAVNAALVEIFSLMGRGKEQDFVARRLFCQARDIGLKVVLYQYHIRYNTLDERRIERIEKAVYQSLNNTTCSP